MKIFTKESGIFIFFLIFIIKIVAYMYFTGKSGFVGGGNDADYYNAYAVGDVTNAVNFWPVLLRFLSELGAYSRQGISVVLFILASIFIPFLYARIIVRQIQIGWLSSKVFWNSLLLIIIYPTIFFYSFDMYRDILMYSSFLAAIYFLSEHLLLRRSVFFSRYLALFILFSFFCVLLREYLGLSLFLSFIIFPFVKIKKWFYSYLLFYFVILIAFYQLELFEALVNYRGEEGFLTGGTTLGITLMDKTNIEFLFLYLYSALVQLFGFYFFNVQGVLAFLAESVPFIFCFVYVVKNRNRLSPLLTYLLVFFVIYNTVWLIGNDNLGTAVRLRVFSYLSIYLSASIIFFQKRLAPVSVSY